jgi:uncharacterized protein YjbI with pentapeptide repeats
MTTERKRIERRTLLRRYAAGERDFSNIDFGETILSDVDLTGINLSGSIFLGTDLTGINLSHANLSGVKFLAVNFTSANLSGSNFSEAELIGCQCVGTDFSHANFDRAILATNVVEEANMFPIEMDNAILIETSFEDAINFNGPGQGSFFYQVTMPDGQLIEGPDWLD